MSALCCPNCFDDRGLRKSIIPSLNPSRGDCNFCGSKDTDLIDPSLLSDVFEMLISIYEQAPEGKSLVDLLKEDWLLFPTLDTAHAKVLLTEILDDGDIVRKCFQPSPAHKSEGLARWDTLRDELMYKNRYFLDEALDADRLKELLSHLIAQDVPEQWYRARILADDQPYNIDQMGAPPFGSASHGRANPSGIPYLYLGSVAKTAVSEIRPHTGEIACVADFTIRQPLVAIDLQDPRRIVSPFVLEDASAVGQMRADIPFLVQLGRELTRPVLRRSAAIDYIPSQYLCEFIKKSGYDGVVYRSSVSDGINLAIFDPSIAIGGHVALFKVDRVSVDISAG